MSGEEILQALKQCGLFTELSDEELSPIARLGAVEHFSAGEIVYRQGDRGRKLYILSEGQVALQRHYEIEGGRQAEKVVYILRESPNRRLMGSWSKLVGEEHIQMCTARCLKPTKLVSFDSTSLKDLIARRPEMRIKLLEKLVLILRERLESSYSAMDTL